MLDYFQVLAFVTNIVVFSLLALKGRSTIFLFRAIALTLSVLIVFTYNVNWLLGEPISLGLANVLFLVLSTIIFFFKKTTKSNLDENNNATEDAFSLKKWFALLFSLVMIFGVGYLYFEGKLDEPNYSVGDAAIHYTFMSRLADTGIISSFLSNDIYVASGYNADFKNHNATYFPGASVGFFVLSKLTHFKNLVTALQVFNIIFFSFVTMYLMLIFRQRGFLRNRWIFFAGILLIGSGTFFDFIFNSYTTQLFGLFLLLAFIDTYDKYLKNRTNFIVPTVILAALIISYFYWLPVALLFMFFSHIKDVSNVLKSLFTRKLESNMKIIGSIVIFVGSLLFSAGYIKSLFEQNLLGYAGAIGGIPRWKLFMPQASLALPIAFLYLYGLTKNKIRTLNRNFVFDFSFAVISYSFVLYVLMLIQKVSGYTMLKSLYLVVPIIWILGLVFLDDYLSKTSVLKFSNPFNYRKMPKAAYFAIKSKLSSKNKKEIYFLMFAILAIVYFRTIRFIPLTIDNLQIIWEEKSRNITSEQMILLDKVRTDFPESLEDNRITAITSFETSLWVYAYNGIWPRTYSLLPKGIKNDNMGSPMGPASPGIIDYLQWLQNDKNHYLLFLDTSSSRDWMKWNGFSFDDYTELASVGKNKLLKLKEGSSARWSVQKNNPSLKKREGVALPYAEDFVSRSENLSALAFKFDVNKKKVGKNDEYIFSLSEGTCDSSDKVVVSRAFGAGSFAEFSDKDFFEVAFDQMLPDSKNAKYCIRWELKEGSGNGMKLIRSIKEKELVLKETYVFKINTESASN